MEVIQCCYGLCYSSSKINKR